MILKDKVSEKTWLITFSCIAIMYSSSASVIRIVFFGQLITTASHYISLIFLATKGQQCDHGSTFSFYSFHELNKYLL